MKQTEFYFVKYSLPYWKQMGWRGKICNITGFDSSAWETITPENIPLFSVIDMYNYMADISKSSPSKTKMTPICPTSYKFLDTDDDETT
jgi:hypothetical protein